MTDARVTQVAVLVDRQVPSSIRVTQTAVLVDRTYPSSIYITQLAILVDRNVQDETPPDPGGGTSIRRRAAFF